MAGFGAEAVVPLQTNGPGLLAQAVAPLDRVVSPDAVAAVTDAFRKGQISADDIIERYGELAKTKEKAQITGLHEFLSPESIQARQSAVNAANTKAVLESSPEYQAAQQAEFVAIKNKAEAGDNEAMRQAMLSKGWPAPSFDPKVGWTPAVRKATEDAFQEFANYFDNVSTAKAFVDDAVPMPIKSSKTTIENGVQKVVATETPRHISKSTGQIVDEKQLGQATAFAAQTPNMWRHMGKPQFLEVFGVKPGKFGGGVSGPLEAPAPTETFPAIGVTPKPGNFGAVVPKEPAPVATALPSLSPTGEIVTSTTETPVKEPPASEVTEKEKLYSQISNSDQFQGKIDRARSQINDALIKPVGPGYSEGSKVNRLLNGLGAFLGVDSSRLKTQTQDQLEQFLAQHVMATIRSLAGSGNRVMRAEVQKEDNNPGLFYASAPRLNSTPETWNVWLDSMKKLFSDARADAVKGLPLDEQPHYPVPPAAAAPTTPTPGGKVSEVSPGKKLVFDGQNYHYVQ